MFNILKQYLKNCKLLQNKQKSMIHAYVFFFLRYCVTSMGLNRPNGNIYTQIIL